MRDGIEGGKIREDQRELVNTQKRGLKKIGEKKTRDGTIQIPPRYTPAAKLYAQMPRVNLTRGYIFYSSIYIYFFFFCIK